MRNKILCSVGGKQKRAVLFFVCAALLMTPVLSFAGQVEGVVRGLNCAVKGISCPIDKQDPVIATERTFVIVTAPGAYYLVPNLDRAVLARHYDENVRLTGKVNQTYKTITADALQVKRNGKWVTTYSQAMVDQWEADNNSDS